MPKLLQGAGEELACLSELIALRSLVEGPPACGGEVDHRHIRTV